IVDALPMGKIKSKGRKPKPSMVFSKNLKKLLGEHKMTLRQAADIVGTSPSVISGWINGATPASPEAVLKLTEALKADYQYIMTGKPSNLIPASRVGEIFDVEDSAEFSGLFLIEAKRLKWRK
ncbi:MAG: helix-turn-helix transcriptional regulator, partial [Bdellovibrionales bacterium]|nr:helix-turn-helix transcriptional regulator [Bdellovibrionales bacterium]